MALYNTFIFEKIKTIFKDYTKYVLENGTDNYDQFKDFTATLLLKMELRRNIIFFIYTI